MTEDEQLDLLAQRRRIFATNYSCAGTVGIRRVPNGEGNEEEMVR